MWSFHYYGWKYNRRLHGFSRNLTMAGFLSLLVCNLNAHDNDHQQRYKFWQCFWLFMFSATLHFMTSISVRASACVISYREIMNGCFHWQNSRVELAAKVRKVCENEVNTFVVDAIAPSTKRSLTSKQPYQCFTVQCCYNAGSFMENPQKRYPISHVKARYVFFSIEALVYLLTQSVQ